MSDSDSFAATLSRLSDAADGSSFPSESAADAVLQRYLANRRREILALVEAAKHAEAILRNGGSFPINGLTWQYLHDALTALDRSNGAKEGT